MVGPPLRALVVEDEWPARNYLVELLNASASVEVIGAVASASEALEVLRRAPQSVALDVAFIDIELSGEGTPRAGLELVRAEQGATDGPLFVLATAYEEHALEAFELGVADYLLKPYSQERVDQCLRRVRERRRDSGSGPRSAGAAGSSRIVARKKRSLVFLDIEDVWAFEASERLTFVHGVEGSFDLDLSLSAIETSFGRAFLRVHRNWLVSAAHVKELSRDGPDTTVFVGSGSGDARRGVRAPVARERALAVRESLLASATGLRRS